MSSGWFLAHGTAGGAAGAAATHVRTDLLLGPAGGLLSGLDPIRAGAGALAGLAFSMLTSYVLEGAASALRAAARAIGTVTSPQLTGAWFTGEYWRVAGVALVLSLPFLFAAAVQALVRSDVGLLARAALVQLPLAVLGLWLLAPVTMLLLRSTDAMCDLVAGRAGGDGARFLGHVALAVAGADSLFGSAFFAVAVGVVILLAALALAVEMTIRAAAVYVVVLLLPIALAAMIWPARRIWAARAVELLVSLILSKFVIVAVLSLAGAALASGQGPGPMLAGMALVLLAVFAPWALLRLLPFSEVAAGAGSILRGEAGRLGGAVRALPDGELDPVAAILGRLPRPRPGADEALAPDGPPGGAGDPSAMGDPLDGRGEAPGGISDPIGGRGEAPGGISDPIGGRREAPGGISDPIDGLSERTGGISDLADFGSGTSGGASDGANRYGPPSNEQPDSALPSDLPSPPEAAGPGCEPPADLFPPVEEWPSNYSLGADFRGPFSPPVEDPDRGAAPPLTPPAQDPDGVRPGSLPASPHKPDGDLR